MNAGKSKLGERNDMKFGLVEKAVKRLLVFLAQFYSKLLQPSMF